MRLSASYGPLTVVVRQDTHLLERPERKELRRNKQVAPPEAPRFSEQAEEPLQAGSLHPGGGLPHAIRIKNERRPHSDQHYAGESPLMGRRSGFLCLLPCPHRN